MAKAYRFGPLAVIDPLEVPHLDLDELIGIPGCAATQHKFKTLIDRWVAADASWCKFGVSCYPHLDSPANPSDSTHMPMEILTSDSMLHCQPDLHMDDQQS